MKCTGASVCGDQTLDEFNFSYDIRWKWYAYACMYSVISLLD